MIEVADNVTSETALKLSGLAEGLKNYSMMNRAATWASPLAMYIPEFMKAVRSERKGAVG